MCGAIPTEILQYATIGNTHQQWRWFANPRSIELFHLTTQEKWQKISPQPAVPGRTRNQSKPFYNLTTPPEYCQPGAPPKIPVTLERTHIKNLYTASYGPPMLHMHPNSESSTFIEELFSSPIQKIISQSHPMVIATEKIFTGVSYFRDKELYTFGWSIRTTQLCCSDGGLVSGSVHSSSTTSLLASLVALLTCINEFLTLPPLVHVMVPSKQIKLDILNESPEGITHMTAQDFDLTTTARRLYQQLKSKTTPNIVNPSDPMSSTLEDSLSAAQDDANEKARECSQDTSKHASIKEVTPSTVVNVERNGEIIVGNFRPFVRVDLYEDDLKETIIKSEKWSDRTFHLVA